MTEKTIADIPMNGRFDPRLATQFMAGAGHNGFLGSRYADHGDDWVELTLDWREDLIGDPSSGVLASSVVISLLDSACSLSIWTKLGEFRPQVTMDLRLDYLRPSPRGEPLFGRGICYHLTHSIGFVRGIAHNGDPDHPLAHAIGTFIRVGDRLP